MPNTRLYRPVAKALDWYPEDIEWIFSVIRKGEGIDWEWIDNQVRYEGGYFLECSHELRLAHELLGFGSRIWKDSDFEDSRFLQIGKLSLLTRIIERASDIGKPKPFFREVLIHLSFADFTLFELRLWARYLAILKHRKSRWVKHVEFKAFGKTFIHWKSK